MNEDPSAEEDGGTAGCVFVAVNNHVCVVLIVTGEVQAVVMLSPFTD